MLQRLLDSDDLDVSSSAYYEFIEKLQYWSPFQRRIATLASSGRLYWGDCFDPLRLAQSLEHFHELMKPASPGAPDNGLSNGYVLGGRFISAWCRHLPLQKPAQVRDDILFSVQGNVASGYFLGSMLVRAAHGGKWNVRSPKLRMRFARKLTSNPQMAPEDIANWLAQLEKD
ncbi:hypothetical protein [Endothiovibrio diazotrophicus]